VTSGEGQAVSVWLRGEVLTNLQPVKDAQGANVLNKAGRLVLRGKYKGQPIKLYEAAGAQHARFVRAVCEHEALADCFPRVVALHGRWIVAHWVANVAENAPPLTALANLQCRLHHLPVSDLPESQFDYWNHFIRPRFVRAVELLEYESCANQIIDLVSAAWSANRVLLHPDLTPVNMILNERGEWQIVDNELLTVGGLPLFDVCNTAFALGATKATAYVQTYFESAGKRATQKELDVLRAAWAARRVGTAFVNGDLQTASHVLHQYEQRKDILPF
jgi:hypothetical protein